MSDQTTGIAQIGTRAAPIPLGATGGGTDVGTYTHGNGQEAIGIAVYDAATGALIPDASVTVTQPDNNTIVLTNTTMGAINCIAVATWEIPAPGNTGVVPATAVVLS